MNTERDNNNPKREPTKFDPQEMVDWFEVTQLLSTGSKTLLSGLFGEFLDHREVQGCLGPAQFYEVFTDTSRPDQVSGKGTQAQNPKVLGSTWEVREKNVEVERNKGSTENTSTDQVTLKDDQPEPNKAEETNGALCFDFIADTGDGFDSTFAVAYTSAHLNLTGVQQGPPALVILGGDQVYPTPSYQDYHDRFRGPFEAAFQESEITPVFAIPGNHDWYDGLKSFLRLFCQKRSLYKLQTHQSRSYFALKLKPNLWLWALDNQLSGDYDLPQKNYFRDVAQNHMLAGSQVILITSTPCWVEMEKWCRSYSETSAQSKQRNNYELLSWFIYDYIHDGRDRVGRDGKKKKFDLILVLTGDLHHYSRYSGSSKNGGEFHCITAGGGGAYTQCTHNLPEFTFDLSRVVRKPNQRLMKTLPKKEAVEDQEAVENILKDILVDGALHSSGRLQKQKSVYPSEAHSRAMVRSGWWLGLKHAFDWRRSWPLPRFLAALFLASSLLHLFLVTLLGPSATQHPWLVAIWSYGPFVLAQGGGWCRFSENGWAGFLHAAVHSVLIGFCGYEVFQLYLQLAVPCELPRLFLVVTFVLGCYAFYAALSGFVIWFYLWLTNKIWYHHDDEASSFVRSTRYKNFLRLKLTDDNLTIYPIKVDPCPEQNRALGNNHTVKVSEPKAELIEAPIHIALSSKGSRLTK